MKSTRLAMLASILAGLAAMDAAPVRAEVTEVVVNEETVAAGKKLWRTRTCGACHGPRGQRAILDYPILAGLNPDYLLQQMIDIKSGDRVGGIDPGHGAARTQGMKDIMHLVNEEEMAAIAAMLSTLPAPEPKPLEHEPQLEAGLLAYDDLGCAGCHGDDGSEPLDVIFPVLAAQKRDYLRNQLVDIREGLRTNSNTEMMVDIAIEATPEQIEAIADYLSQVAR